MTHKDRYTYTFQCNSRPKNWRERIAKWLRIYAQKLDGQYSLAVQMDSEPPLPRITQNQIIIVGLEHMERMFKEAVSSECMERLYKRALPQMFIQE